MRQNQESAEQTTDTVQLEDETIATSRAATAVPLGIGQMKTAIRWITPVYGQSTTQTARTNTDKNK